VQQYIIVDFLVSWIGIICQIKHVRVAKFILDTLPWILKMPNANKNPEECLIIIRKNINNNFATYYKYNKDIMEKTILIIIKEASPKANNINVVAWDLLNLFLKKAEIYMVMYLSKKKENKVYISANTKILNLKSTDNNKEINVCQNGIIYFITDYNDNETNIFDPNDIIEFNTTIEDKNLNKYSTKCRLWKPLNENIRLFCKLNDNLIQKNIKMILIFI